MEKHFCSYGCKTEANFQLKNGKWCCCNRFYDCIEYKKKISSFSGKHHTEETKKKIIYWSGKKLSKNHINKLKEAKNGKYLGKDNPFYGKHHSKEFKEKQSQYMLNGGAIKASSKNGSVSKPQIKLYDSIKEIYPTAKINHSFLNYLLDVAIPELKIWFESDGSYWHQDKEKDLERQKKIEKFGWKCIRYKADYVRDIPQKSKLIQDVEDLMKG
jgi:hypothetical protein